MPNPRAVEGAIKYAERQRRRSLAQKLSEIAQQKLEEELNDEFDNNEDECEVIEQKSNQFIRNSNVLQSNDDLQLKPKPLRKEPQMLEDSNSKFQASESESDAEVKTVTNTRSKTPDIDEQEEDEDNSNDSLSLKPKAVKKVTINKSNPFKVSNNSVNRINNKRKKDSDSEDEISDDEEKSRDGFKRFYKEMKQIIKDDNSDVEDERDLIEIAKQQFNQLDSSERKSWAKDKRKTKRNNSEIVTKSEVNENKITKFFKRN
jgi:hypothetical protein